MPPEARNLPGQVYRCPVCGAEVAVICPGTGPLAPRCCNRFMERLPKPYTIYECPICGSAVMVIHVGAGSPAPRCCNVPMRAVAPAA